MTRHVPFVLMFLAGVVAALVVLSAFQYGMARAAPVLADASSHASVLPPDAIAAAPPAAVLHDPVTDPTGAVDDVMAARRLGWPIAVGVIAALIALALGTAGARISWLSWLARGTAATLLGSVTACGSAAFDAALSGGSGVAVAAAAVGAALAFWRAHRAAPVAVAADRPRELGAVHPLLAIAFGALITAGSVGAWSCSSARQHARAVGEAVIDCTTAAAHRNADEYGALLAAAIRAATSPDGHVDTGAIKAALVGLGLETGGCLAALTFERLIAESPAGRTATGAYDPVGGLKSAWEVLRRELWAGVEFRTAAGPRR